MARLIGAIIIVLLLIGPLLVQTGLLDQAGLIREFVDLETKVFLYLVDAVRDLAQRLRG